MWFTHDESCVDVAGAGALQDMGQHVGLGLRVALLHLEQQQQQPQQQLRCEPSWGMRTILRAEQCTRAVVI